MDPGLLKLPSAERARTEYQSALLRLSKRFAVAPTLAEKRCPGRPKVDRVARAQRWQAMIDGDLIRNRADLARHLGVSRARVTQVLSALRAG